MEEGKVNGDARDDGKGAIPGPTNPMVTPLLTDLYQFTMAYAYWKAGKHNERAVLRRVQKFENMFVYMELYFSSLKDYLGLRRSMATVRMEVGDVTIGD
ncbi:nicotinate phosphoribosyltransferase 2 [Tanacetum coccineum]